MRRFRSDEFVLSRGVLFFVVGLSVVFPWPGGCVEPDPPPIPDSGLTGDYVGSNACYTCHSRMVDHWALTRHARSYQTLVDVGQDQNSVCLTCHTTGYGAAGGFVDPITTAALAGVGCEACHGPSKLHRTNVADEDLRPPVTVSVDVCSGCHNSFHYDTYDQWKGSRHAAVTPSVASSFTQGRSLNSCGTCHSGDFRLAKFIEGQANVSDALLAGVPADQMNAVTCSICHDPHMNTGMAIQPPAGHDWQLRYPQATAPVPSNTIADTTNPARFEGCGQCHHTRDRVWTDTDRGPHSSVQANFYLGEMPVPDGTSPLVPNNNSVHRFVLRQCSTCHMQHEIRGSSEYSQHQFAVVSTAGCTGTGCHPTGEGAAADMSKLQSQIQTGLENIAARLGDPASWEYSQEGGPPDSAQAALPEQVKKVRYMYHYLKGDGSLGVHNPGYAKALLLMSDQLLRQIGR